MSPARFSPKIRWIAALLCVVLAALSRWALDPLFLQYLPFPTFLLAVLFTAWALGWEAGATIMALSMVVMRYLFLDPRHELTLPNRGGLTEIAMFLLVGGASILFVEHLRRSQARLQSLAEQSEKHKQELQREVRDRIQSQQELWDRREMLRVTLESIGDAVVVTDPRGRVTLLNAIARSLTGWRQEDAEGKPLQQVLTIVGLSREHSLEESIVQAMREQAVVALPDNPRLVTRHGQQLPIEANAAPIRDERGVTIGTVLVFRDITQKRRDEQSSRRLAELVASSQEAIVGLSVEGTVDSWNRGAEELFGYRASEVIGRNISLLVEEGEPLSPESRLSLGQVDRNAPIEAVRVRKNGDLVDVTLRVSPLTDGFGQIVGASVIYRDIGEQRRAERRRAARLEVVEVLSAAERIEDAGPEIIRAICDGLGWQAGAVWFLDQDAGVLHCQSFWKQPGVRVDEFAAATRTMTFALGVGLPGRVWAARRPVWIADVTQDGNFPRAHVASVNQLHGAFGAPLFDGNEFLGVIEFFSSDVREPDVDLLELMTTLGGQVGQFVRRRELAAQLQGREEELRLITDGVPALISYVDAEERYQFINRQYEVWFGRSREELYGRTIAEVLGPDGYRAVQEHLRAVLDGQDVTYESWIDSNDGKRFIQARYVPRFSSSGEVEGFFVHVTDNTQRKRAEELLEESEQRFRSMADSAPVMLWISDADMRCSYLNRRWREFTGQSSDGDPGDAWEQDIFPEDRDRRRHTYETCFTERRPFETEYRLRRADGRYRWIWDAGVPRFTPSGEFAGYIGSCLDITDRKQAAIEMTAAKEAAEDANRVKSQFLANISHELRTPLNAIIGMTDLSLESEVTSEVRAYLSTVKSASRDLLGLVNEVLDFARLEANSFVLEPIKFDSWEAVDSVVAALAPLAEEKGLDLFCEFDGNVPERLIGDVSRLRHIVRNLVGNAVKFTQRGEIVLRVSALRMTPEAAELQFTVTDTGIGIPPDKHAAIFEPFAQADASMTRLYGGTGLGLAIARSLVGLMHGRIWVESEPDVGSQFHFTAVFARPGGAAAGPPRHEGILGGTRALVVDSRETSRALLRHTLDDWKASTETAADATSACERLRDAARSDAPFHVVLVEAGLPDVDTLVQEIGVQRAGTDGEGRDSPRIIWLTRVGQEPPQIAGATPDTTASLTAPITPPRLRAALVHAVRTGERTPSAEHLPETSGSPVSPLPPAARKLRVLLAEDTRANQELVSSLLRKRGHSVEIARDGHAAVELCRKTRYDVILMDLQMPGMDGFETTAAIREGDAAGADVPIMALTAHVMAGDRDRCLAAGMNGYIPKPIDAIDMIQSIESLTSAWREETEGRLPDRKSETSGTPTAAPSRQLDLETALARLGGDRQLFAEIVQLFREDLPALVNDMRRGLKTCDVKIVIRAAHTLKNMAATCGGDYAASLAAKVELLAAGTDRDATEASVQALIEAIEQLANVLPRDATESFAGAKQDGDPTAAIPEVADRSGAS